MKTKTVAFGTLLTVLPPALFLSVFLSVVLFFTPSCAQFPKDTYGKKVELLVNTPWGPSGWKADEIATGKAALEASKDTVRVIEAKPQPQSQP